MSYWPRSPTVFLLLIFVAVFSCEDNDEILPKNSTQKQEDSCTTLQCYRSANFIDKRMNKNGDPCDDFYDYVCGDFERFIHVPNDHPKINAETKAATKVQSRLQLIVEEIDEKTALKPFRLIKTYYNNCIRDELLENHQAWETWENVRADSGGWPLHDRKNWNSTRFNKKKVLKHIFRVNYEEDLTNVTNYVLGLSMKNPLIHRYYFQKMSIDDVFTKYLNYMVNITVSFGIDEKYSFFHNLKVLLIEDNLLTYVFTEKTESDWYRQYTRTTLDELEKKYPTLGFRELFRRYDNPTIQLPVNFETLDRLEYIISSHSEIDLANWIVWRSMSKYLKKFMRNLAHGTKTFEDVLKVRKERKSREAHCVFRLRKIFPLSLGALYQTLYMNETIVKDLTEMFNNTKQQFSRFVQEAQWVTESTKNQALNKIKKVNSNLYTCPKFISYDELEAYWHDLELGDDSLHSNNVNIRKFMEKVQARKALHSMSKSSQTDCEKFLLPGNIFELNHNYLNFVAELYEDKLYNVDRPKYLNYGAIGSRMGHHISNTVDGHGKYFDVNGTLNLWWDSESLKKYDDKMECFVRHYGEFFALLDESHEEVFLDSSSTLKVNVADNVGISTAYYAYLDWVDKNGPEKKLPGLDHTPRQLFWISMATTHCTKYQSKYLRHLLKTGTRTPTKFRVNGPLSNMPEFAADFKCSPNSRMYSSHECRVW